MNPERWRQVEDLYYRALERPEKERAAFLLEACSGDEALHLEVVSLLEKGQGTGSFLQAAGIGRVAEQLSGDRGQSWMNRQIGSYQILSILGVGGMGEVYRARDTKLKRDVAIKVLPSEWAKDSERLARFRREAQILASLNHSNIAAIYGLEESQGVPCVVMELVEGETLAEHLSRGPLKTNEALRIGIQIAEALEAAHEKHVIHRDLKPANIKLTAENKVKVLDFGLAKIVAGGDSTAVTAGGATVEGAILGTPAYMSPEQLRGQPLDRRTDIWAFGCVLYEMLTGSVAFPGDSVSDHIAAILERDPNWASLPKATPPAIARVLRRCLEKDSRRRVHDIADVRIELEDAVDPAQLGTAGSIEPNRGHAGRWVWTVLVLALISAIVLGGVYFRRPDVAQRNVRLSVVLPEGIRFSGGIALSPDGRQLALVASDPSGQTVIWVRTLESVDSRRLAGTENASWPFWSPDSRFIGFFAEEKLKKIEAAGGSAQTICEAPNSRGGTWSQEGLIVFAVGNPLGRLYQVPASGGKAALLTVPGNAQRWPHFLPDGRHFLYLDLNPRTNENFIVVVSLDSGESKRILPSIEEAVFAPPDYLLSKRGATLMAFRFDLKTFALSGDPLVVAEGLKQGDTRGVANFSVSDGGEAVFVGEESAANRLVWLDRGGQESATVIDDSGGGPELSPDGSHVVFTRLDPQTQVPYIWLFDLSRKTSSRLTFGPSSDFTPVWSPDGNTVTFTSNRAGSPDLYQRSIGGTADELLLKSPYRKNPTEYSRDGQFIIYTNQDPKTKSDIWILPVKERQPFVYLSTEFNEGSGHLSPDGHWMAYVSDESGRDEVYVQRFPDRGSKIPISTQGGSRPQWSQDGTELFYVSSDQKLMAVNVKASSTLQAGIPKTLFPLRLSGWDARNDYAYSRNNYAVTADGRVLVNETADPKPAPITVVLNWKAGLKPSR